MLYLYSERKFLFETRNWEFSMSRALIPNLNYAEQLVGCDALQSFIDAPWYVWTHCSGMKRPPLWRFKARVAYRKLVKLNQDIMLDMLGRGDVEDLFVFGKNIGLVHRISHRADFGTRVVEQLPFTRQLFTGNSCLRGGMTNRHGIRDVEFGV